MSSFLPRKIALLLLASTLVAQVSTLSLKEARQRALARNWDLLSARSDLEVATAQQQTSKEFPNPGLALGASKILSEGSPASPLLGNGFSNRYDSNASLSQLLELGGKRSHRQASAQAGLQAADFRIRDAQRTLEGTVIKGFVAAVLAQDNAQQMERTADSLTRSAGIAAKRYEAGDISQAEKSQVEIAAQRFSEDARLARTAAIQARINLDVLLGDPKPAGAWTPKESLEDLEPLFKALGSSGDASSRPDIEAAEAQVRKSQEELALQKAQVVPDLTVSFSYVHQPPDQGGNLMGVGVGFTLPLWNRNQGAIAGARAAETQAKRDRARAEARARSEQMAARVSYEAALLRARNYRSELLPSSEKVRESVSFAYERGAASFLELLEAQRSATEIRIAAAQAAADALSAGVDLATANNLSLPMEVP